MEASAAETATGGSSVRLRAFSSNHSVAQASAVYTIVFGVGNCGFWKDGSGFIVETATKNTVFSGKKRGFYPVENFVDFKRFFGSFPRVFQDDSPQSVENSVDSSVKKQEKPHKSKEFAGFTWIKSVFGAVDKFRLVLFFVENNFPQRKSKNLWKSHKLTNQRHKKERAGKPVLFGRIRVFYNVQINRSITP